MKRAIITNLIWMKHYFNLLKLTFVKPQYQGKIFCIGFNKTGTSSLGKSLELLGYKNSSFNKVVWNNYYLNNRIDKVLDYTSKFDSFDDLPWLKEEMIPVLDKTFPKSKFIYLTREEKAWKKSLYDWRFKTFGDYPDLEQSVKEYRAHEKFVLEYFKNRPDDDFLILDIKDNKGFKKLATFLGKEANQDGFPHLNKA